MKIFTRIGLHRHDSEQRRAWIRWAYEQAGVPPPKHLHEQQVIADLRRASQAKAERGIDIQALADEAERGYELDQIQERRI